jgi:hypothetical protein
MICSYTKIKQYSEYCDFVYTFRGAVWWFSFGHAMLCVATSSKSSFFPHSPKIDCPRQSPSEL